MSTNTNITELTIPEVESMITSKKDIYLLNILRDYLAKEYNKNFSNINSNLNSIKASLNGLGHIQTQSTNLKGWFKTLNAGITAVANPQRNDYFYVETDITHMVQPYIYNGTIWEKLGEAVNPVDLTNYVTKQDPLFDMDDGAIIDLENIQINTK